MTAVSIFHRSIMTPWSLGPRRRDWTFEGLVQSRSDLEYSFSKAHFTILWPRSFSSVCWQHRLWRKIQGETQSSNDAGFVEKQSDLICFQVWRCWACVVFSDRSDIVKHTEVSKALTVWRKTSSWVSSASMVRLFENLHCSNRSHFVLGHGWCAFGPLPEMWTSGSR